MPRLGKTRRKSRSRSRSRSHSRSHSHSRARGGSFPFAGHNYALTRGNSGKPLSPYPNVENSLGQIVDNAHFYHDKNEGAARYRAARDRYGQ